MTDLKDRQCLVCRKGDPALEKVAIDRLLAVCDGWSLSADGTIITRSYQFKNYFRTMAFVNAVAWIAHQQDHHPDLDVSYNRCTVHYSTHAVGGLSENDFICAAKIDALDSEERS